MWWRVLLLAFWLFQTLYWGIQFLFRPEEFRRSYLQALDARRRRRGTESGLLAWERRVVEGPRYVAQLRFAGVVGLLMFLFAVVILILGAVMSSAGFARLSP